MEYKVKYEIDVDAKTPEEAALQVADIMRHGSYRPYLTVTSPDGKITDVDLEISTVGVERTPKTNGVKDSYEDGICPDCSEGIPDNIEEGISCINCGHVFWKEHNSEK